MQNATSHMVPKMIFVNVLAVIMMTFEQHAPAEMKDKPAPRVKAQPAQPEAPLKVSAKQQEAVTEKVVAPKKPMYKARHASPPPKRHLVQVKQTNGPRDCCFRGYY